MTGAAMAVSLARVRVFQHLLPCVIWRAWCDGLVLVLVGLALGTLAPFLVQAEPAPNARNAPSAGSPERVTAALVDSVGTSRVEAAARLFADDALLIEWRPTGAYRQATDAAQRGAWLEEQAALGRRITAENVLVRGQSAAWRAWIVTDDGHAGDEVQEERVSLLVVDDDGRIRGWSLFTPDACSVVQAYTWPCSDLFPAPE